MKKIFLVLIALLFLLLPFAALFAQSPDTAFVQAAADLYQPKANKGGVSISATAPLPLFRKADNKILWVKSNLQGQVDNVNSVMTAKANIASVDTAKANIRSEISDKYNYVNTTLAAADSSAAAYTEATYQKKIGLTTSNNVLYVSRKWTGVRGGASWQTQLDAAAVGSPVATYPDPWAARDVASKLLVAGTVPRVTIIVGEGEIFTAAQDIENQIVDYNYRVLPTGQKYHPYPSQVAGTDSAGMSMFFPNLIWEFKKGSGITYTKGKGCFGVSWDTTAIQSVRGLGNFSITTNNSGGHTYNLYYLGKGLVEVEADSFTLKCTNPSSGGWSMISFNGGRSIFKANYFATWDGNAPFRGLYNDTKIQIQRLKIDTTFLTNTSMGTVFASIGTSNAVISIDIDNAELANMGLVSYGNSFSNILFNMSVKNLTQKYWSDKIGSYEDNTNLPQSPLFLFKNASFSNVLFTARINNYKGQKGLIGSTSLSNTNSMIKLESDNFYQDELSFANVQNKTLANLVNTNTNSLIEISGNFINKVQPVLVISSNSDVTIRGSMKTLSTSVSTITVTGDNSKTKIAANLTSDDSQNSISGTGIITCLPSSTANVASAGTVTVNGTLNVNSNFKQ